MVKRWKDYSKAALLKRARRLGIAGCESMTKRQLIHHISRRCKKRKSRKAVSCRRKVSRRKSRRKSRKGKRKSRKSSRKVSKRAVKGRKGLAGKNVKQLKKLCKKAGKKGYSKKKRAGLLRMLRGK